MQKQKFLIHILFAMFISFLLLSACAETPKTLLRLDFVKVGNPGIIGDYEFRTEFSKELQPLKNSTVVVAVYSNVTNKLISIGNGLIVKDIGGDKPYLLTVRHNIFDTKTGSQKGNKILFGYEKLAEKKIGYEAIYLDALAEILPTDPNNSDLLYLPIENRKGFPAFPLSGIKNIDEIAGGKNFSIGNFLSISALSTRDDRGVVHFYQTDFKMDVDARFGSYAKLGLDTVKGVSGSPVFYHYRSNTYLLGLVSKQNRTRDCKDFDLKTCHNLVALIEDQKL